MRVDLRLGDLRGRSQVASKLMNVKIPTEVNQKIQKVAEALRASKTEVVIALLNEGLDVSESLIQGVRRRRGAKRARATNPGPRVKTGAKLCSEGGCRRSAVARGLCTKHYQAERRKRMAKGGAR
jgi:hypothetical protein